MVNANDGNGTSFSMSENHHDSSLIVCKLTVMAEVLKSKKLKSEWEVKAEPQEPINLDFI